MCLSTSSGYENHPTPRVLDSLSLGWSLITCISNVFPGVAHAAGPGTTPCSPLLCELQSHFAWRYSTLMIDYVSVFPQKEGIFVVGHHCV